VRSGEGVIPSLVGRGAPPQNFFFILQMEMVRFGAFVRTVFI